jgi:hypothetical protein
MKLSLTSYRRYLLTISVLLIVTALIVIIFVIPEVKAEVQRGGTLQIAYVAFWINIILTVLAALVIWFIAIRTKGRRFLPMFILGLIAFITLLLGWALGDAGGAYSGHGSAMKTASIFLFIGCGIDLFAVLALIAAMLFFPKQI